MSDFKDLSEIEPILRDYIKILNLEKLEYS